MTGVLEAALTYARRGWPVFPVHGIVSDRCTCARDCSSPGKHPLVRRGLHEATTDLDDVNNWWTCWPFANVAIATGCRSGLAVIDIDGPEGEASVALLEELDLHLSPTLTAITGNGQHLYFAYDHALPNTTGRLPGMDDGLAGIDLRAEGGYVVAPPSLHTTGNRYSWRDTNTAIARAPEWLREKPRPPLVIEPPPFRDGYNTPQGKAALERQLDILSRAREGERNDTLNRCAFIVGLFIHSGHLDEPSARAALTSAGLQIGLSRWETERTITSALHARGPGLAASSTLPEG